MRQRSPKNDPQTSKKGMRYLVLLVVNSVLCFALYQSLLLFAERTGETFYSFLVMLLYTVLLFGFVLAYLIYNRFLYRKGLTPEQLDPAWSEEQKRAFLEDGEQRLERSRWMMTVIFPLVLTFLLDALDLFVLQYLR